MKEQISIRRNGSGRGTLYLRPKREAAVTAREDAVSRREAAADKAEAKENAELEEQEKQRTDAEKRRFMAQFSDEILPPEITPAKEEPELTGDEELPEPLAKYEPEDPPPPRGTVFPSPIAISLNEED